jgi:hypothetical protein
MLPAVTADWSYSPRDFKHKTFDFDKAYNDIKAAL